MPDAQINGFRMHYEDTGSGEAVILHHGYMGRHDHWAPLLDHLPPTRRYIRLDCRGAGESDAPDDDYNFRQMAADTIALADHLEIDRFSFAGWSMGGGVGWQLGLNHATRLDKLILVAPAPAGVPAFLAAMERGEVDPSLFDAIGGIIAAASVGDRAQLHQAAQHLYLRSPAADVYERVVDGMAQAAPAHIAFFDDLEGNGVIDGADDLSQLQTPTLMLAGAHDSLIATNIAEYQALPNATLHVFSGCGHMFPHEVPEATAEAVDDFLRHGVRAFAPIPEDLKAATS